MRSSLLGVPSKLFYRVCILSIPCNLLTRLTFDLGGIQVVPVKMDLEGMRPDGPGGLEDVLKNWDQTKGKRPHLMYTITFVPHFSPLFLTAN